MYRVASDLQILQNYSKKKQGPGARFSNLHTIIIKQLCSNSPENLLLCDVKNIDISTCKIIKIKIV